MRQLSRYPGAEWQHSYGVHIYGPFTRVYLTVAWAAIGRAHDSGHNNMWMSGQLDYYNSAGTVLRTDQLGTFERAGGGEGLDYSCTNTRTPINNRAFDCPAGTARVELFYAVYSGGFEAHDTGDRSPANWDPSVSLAAGGVDLWLPTSNNTEYMVSNQRL